MIVCLKACLEKALFFYAWFLWNSILFWSVKLQHIDVDSYLPRPDVNDCNNEIDNVKLIHLHAADTIESNVTLSVKLMKEANSNNYYCCLLFFHYFYRLHNDEADEWDKNDGDVNYIDG